MHRDCACGGPFLQLEFAYVNVSWGWRVVLACIGNFNGSHSNKAPTLIIIGRGAATATATAQGQGLGAS